MTGLGPVSEKLREEEMWGGVGLHGTGCLPALAWPWIQSLTKNGRREEGQGGREGAAHEASGLGTSLLFSLSSSAKMNSARRQKCRER